MSYWRKKTPTVIQMEAVECGAACLGILLGSLGRYVPLEELRYECGVSRDGSNALNIIKAAGRYGLQGKGFRWNVNELKTLENPVILLWEFNHFVVLEGFGRHKIYLNDPGFGPRTVTYEEFEESYSGITLTFTPTAEFEVGGRPPGLFKALFQRLKNAHSTLLYLFLNGLGLLLPGLALPAFSRIFIDRILVAKGVVWEWPFLGALLLVTLLGAIIFAIQKYYLARLVARLSIQFSGKFLWHMLRLPLAFYMQRYPGEIAYRSTLNGFVARQLAGTLTSATLDLILVFFYGLVMLAYDVKIGIIGFIAAFLNIAILLLIQRSRRDAYARWQQETGKWMGSAIGALQQMEAIKAVGTEGDAFARYTGYYTKNLNAQQEISKKDALLGTTPILLQTLAMAALLGLGSIRVIEGTLTFGMLVALQTLMVSFLAPINRFVNYGQVMQTIQADIGRLDDVLKNERDPIYESRKPASYEEEHKLEGYLEFRNVTFGYSRLAPPLIENLSFQITPGQRLALVGPSGCGKSTIAKLAAGLFVPWEGEIFYDGKLLKNVSAEVFYNSIGHVDQETFLFSGTIHDNITLWNESVTEEMVVHAATASAIHDEIMLREHGYGNQLAEGGKNLSGGQRQRLEIARSFLLSPSLLIMDEATSALDSETERTISDNLRRQGCSAMMIAHRLSTIQDCDEIIVLERGKVVERGSHEELKQQGGLYHQLIESENA